jgi:hypothetical protein
MMEGTGRTVINKQSFLTVGELRTFLNSAEGLALNENAFIWIPQEEESWAIACVTAFAIEKVCTPEDGFPEESGLCLYAKDMRNKKSEGNQRE